jgi:two-component system, cell cycle sensor histidine kinase and response regulator CckA
MRLCERHPGEIHLVLTDVVLPQLSGPQLSEHLVRLRPGAAVLYMSGFTDSAISQHGVLRPGTWFLAKPFTSADLTSKVRAVLDATRRR